YNSTDESTAEDNHLFIEGFFKKYQSFKGNPFYIAGESYGGIYGPMLAQRILRSKSDINLKGFRPPMMSFNANHYDDCPTYKHIDWINTPEVRKALHVSIDDTHKWTDCTDGIYYYTKPTPQFPVIKELLDVYNLEKFVAFNGNFDTMCDHITTQYFIDSLGISKMSGYRPWYKSDGSVAGYVQNYKRGVTWVLVLAAGHMVPQNQPDSALQMIKMVIDIKT
ncbi:unnamed protein product, partial [Oppiella nova]